MNEDGIMRTEDDLKERIHENGILGVSINDIHAIFGKESREIVNKLMRTGQYKVRAVPRKYSNGAWRIFRSGYEPY